MEIALGVIWLALSAAVGFYARSKGGSGPGMFFASIFLTPPIGFAIVRAMKTDENRVALAQRQKLCSVCGESVQACGGCDFSDEEPNRQADKAA